MIFTFHIGYLLWFSSKVAVALIIFLVLYTLNKNRNLKCHSGKVKMNDGWISFSYSIFWLPDWLLCMLDHCHGYDALNCSFLSITSKNNCETDLFLTNNSKFLFKIYYRTVELIYQLQYIWGHVSCKIIPLTLVFQF